MYTEDVPITDVHILYELVYMFLLGLQCMEIKRVERDEKITLQNGD